MRKLNTYPIEILLIESIPQNIELVTQMLNRNNYQYHLHIAKNISETFSFLNQENKYKDEPKPDIILIHPTLVSGFEKDTSDEIYNNKSFLHIPVLVLKIINNKIEITKAINKQINHQSTKSLDIKYFLETIISLKKFMGSLVKPSGPEIKIVPEIF